MLQIPSLFTTLNNMVTCYQVWEASGPLVEKVQKVYFKQGLDRRECFEISAELATVIGGLGSLTAPQEVAAKLNLLSKIGVFSKKSSILYYDTSYPQTSREYAACGMKVLELTTPLFSSASLVIPGQSLDVASVIAHSLNASCQFGIELFDIKELKNQKKAVGSATYTAIAITVADIVLPILAIVGLNHDQLAKVGLALTQKLSEETIEHLKTIKNHCLRGNPQHIRSIVLWLPEFSNASSKYMTCALKKLTASQDRLELVPAASAAVALPPSIPLRQTKEQLEQEHWASIRQGIPFSLRTLDTMSLMPESPSTAHVSRQLAQRATGIADLSRMTLTPASIEEYSTQFDTSIPEEFRDQDPFNDYTCPITTRPIRYPIRFIDGITLYERAALRQFLHDHPHEPLPGDERPDQQVKETIDEKRIGRVISEKCEEIKSALKTLLPTLIG